MLAIIGYVTKGQTVERDSVRELESAVVVSFCLRNAFVEPEEIFRVGVVDDQDDVVEHVENLVWEVVEGIGDQRFEFISRNRFHPATLGQGPGDGGRCRRDTNDDSQGSLSPDRECSNQHPRCSSIEYELAG